MSSPESSVGRFYDGWHIYNERIVEVVRDLSPEGLMVRPAPERWPIWATVGHTAGMRVYWLCGVFGEPGAERTPFPDARSGIGWEGDLETPRTAAGLTEALQMTCGQKGAGAPSVPNTSSNEAENFESRSWARNRTSSSRSSTARFLACWVTHVESGCAVTLATPGAPGRTMAGEAI